MHVAWPVVGNTYYVRSAAGVTPVTVDSRVWKVVSDKRTLYVTCSTLPGVLVPYVALQATYDHALTQKPLGNTNDWPTVARKDAEQVSDWVKHHLDNDLPFG
jgi:hypothetical protein